MMICMVSSFVLSLLFPTTIHAFVYNPQKHPALKSLDDNNTNKNNNAAVFQDVLKLRLDLELTNNDPSTKTSLPRLALNGPTLQLRNDEIPTSTGGGSEYLCLPGQEGIFRKVSTRSKSLRVLDDASYIGMEGLQTVPLEKGCWEMLWIDESFSGRLICGFELPVPIDRNGITFEAGPMFMSFQIYSQETLAAAQAFKFVTQQHSTTLLNKQEEEFVKMKNSNNPLSKAIHYSRAYSAFDKLLLLPTVSHIPDGIGGDTSPSSPFTTTKSEFIQLKNGLVVVKEGIVWRKLNAMFGPSSESLGKVYVSVVAQDGDDDKNDMNKLRP